MTWLVPAGILVVGLVVVFVALRRTASRIEAATAASRAFTDDLRMGTAALRSDVESLDAGLHGLRQRFRR